MCDFSHFTYLYLGGLFDFFQVFTPCLLSNVAYAFLLSENSSTSASTERLSNAIDQ
ncbi:hypothetical protein ALTERO38_51564 [Alteromonas sp. 38]|nr:hypothetical protein ALTER154_80109 [Alteromonas sp. 154]VXB78475.1 hypothetical protein ALTERO38_51564 [Alteromonas sp. 38]